MQPVAPQTPPLQPSRDNSPAPTWIQEDAVDDHASGEIHLPECAKPALPSVSLTCGATGLASEDKDKYADANMLEYESEATAPASYSQAEPVAEGVEGSEDEASSMGVAACGRGVRLYAAGASHTGAIPDAAWGDPLVMLGAAGDTEGHSRHMLHAGSGSGSGRPGACMSNPMDAGDSGAEADVHPGWMGPRGEPGSQGQVSAEGDDIEGAWLPPAEQDDNALLEFQWTIVLPDHELRLGSLVQDPGAAEGAPRLDDALVKEDLDKLRVYLMDVLGLQLPDKDPDQFRYAALTCNRPIAGG